MTLYPSGVVQLTANQPPGRKRPEFLTVLGIVVGGVLLLGFLITSVGVLRTVNDPPLLADPAPDAPPTLVCAIPVDQTTTDGAGATEGAQSEDGAAATAGAATPGAIATCPEDQVRLVPQYRGSYDPNARLMGLLAVIMPLLTTIVAFYFGQRAGAGEGAAAKEIAQQFMTVQSEQQLTDLQQRLRSQGKL